MEHNDATDKDLPIDADATEVVATDLEALLHRELDAQRELAPRTRPLPKTVPMMKAVPRNSRSRIPLSTSPIPRAPIHTLLPPAHMSRDLENDEDDATCVFDRASGRSSVPSIRSVAFPAPNFSAPRAPLPFATIPAIPAAKRLSADESQQATPVQPVLAPTSRREIKVLKSAYESLAPTAMPSVYPSWPPPAPIHARRGSTLALVLTLTFAIASVLVMGVAVAKPSVLSRGKIAVSSAMNPKQAAAQPPAVAVALPAADPAPSSIVVPPVLIENDELGENDAALLLPESAKGHRIFVDGRAVGDGDAPVITDCGKHKVQVGSNGAARLVDLPCGGSLRLE